MIQLRVKLLIFIAFFGTVLFINYKTQDEYVLKDQTIVGSESNNSKSASSNQRRRSSRKIDKKIIDNAQKVFAKGKKVPVEVVKPSESFQKAQMKFSQVHANKEARKKFLDKAFLNFEFPPGFNFVEVASERDDMMILNGRDDKSNADFSIFASEYIPTEAELLGFLSEKSTVSSIGDGLQNIEKIRTVDSKPGSGLKRIVMYQGRSSSSLDTYVAWVPRRDNAGNYLFILSAEPSYIDQMEDYFDEIKNKMKALDAR